MNEVISLIDYKDFYFWRTLLSTETYGVHDKVCVWQDEVKKNESILSAQVKLCLLLLKLAYCQ